MAYDMLDAVVVYTFIYIHDIGVACASCIDVHKCTASIAPTGRQTETSRSFSNRWEDNYSTDHGNISQTPISITFFLFPTFAFFITRASCCFSQSESPDKSGVFEENASLPVDAILSDVNFGNLFPYPVFCATFKMILLHNHSYFDFDSNSLNQNATNEEILTFWKQIKKMKNIFFQDWSRLDWSKV
jgi:hypothetical protein